MGTLTMMRVVRISDSMRGSTPGCTLAGAKATPFGTTTSLCAAERWLRTTDFEPVSLLDGNIVSEQDRCQRPVSDWSPMHETPCSYLAVPVTRVSKNHPSLTGACLGLVGLAAATGPDTSGSHR